MGSVQKILPHYTIEDWQHWEGAWELIDGFPIAMSPSPIPRHQRVASEMTAELVIALRTAGCRRCRLYQPIDYVITNDTILVPDLLIVCGKIQKKFLDFAPLLVIEISSPSTVLRDRNTKRDLYQQQGVKYYLIVDAEEEKVELHELIDGIYSVTQNPVQYQFELEEGCTISPDLSRIFEN